MQIPSCFEFGHSAPYYNPLAGDDFPAIKNVKNMGIPVVMMKDWGEAIRILKVEVNR